MGGQRNATLDRAAELLVDLTRRMVAWSDIRTFEYRTVGQILDAGEDWRPAHRESLHVLWLGQDRNRLTEAVLALDRLLEQPKRGLFSTAFLERELKGVVRDLAWDLFAEQDASRSLANARQHLTVVRDRLNGWNECRDVVVPISNLQLLVPGKALRIGDVLLVRDDLFLRLTEQSNLSPTTELHRWAAQQHDLTTAEGRSACLQEIGEVYTYGKVFGVPGDQIAALQYAEREVEWSLSILRLLDASFFAPHHRVELMGSPTGGTRIALMAREACSTDPHTIEQAGSARADTPFILQTYEAQRSPEQFGYQWRRMDNQIAVQMRLDFFERVWPIVDQLVAIRSSGDGGWAPLVTAVRWFSDAVRSDAAEDAFIKFAIVVETILGKEEEQYKETTTTRLSERLGFLLGEEDPARRWSIYRAFKDLYGKRSGIVHAGRMVSNTDVERMEEISRLTVMRMVWEIHHRRHVNLTAFLDWVRKLRFGEPFEPIDVPNYLRLRDAWFSP